MKIETQEQLSRVADLIKVLLEIVGDDDVVSVDDEGLDCGITIYRVQSFHSLSPDEAVDFVLEKRREIMSYKRLGLQALLSHVKQELEFQGLGFFSLTADRDQVTLDLDGLRGAVSGESLTALQRLLATSWFGEVTPDEVLGVLQPEDPTA